MATIPNYRQSEKGSSEMDSGSPSELRTTVVGSHVEYVDTSLTVDEMIRTVSGRTGGLLVGPDWVWEHLGRPQESRPRVWGYLEPTGKTVRLSSRKALHRYAGELAFTWTTHGDVKRLIDSLGGVTR